VNGAPAMRPTLRKLGLTAHVTASVGWLGAVVAYLEPWGRTAHGRRVQQARAGRGGPAQAAAEDAADAADG
jgi:hypothetical protein